MKSDIIFGFHPVREMLAAKRRKVFQVYFSKERPQPRFHSVLALAQKCGAVIDTRSSGELKQMSGSDHHQGICADVEPYPLVDIHELINPSVFGDKAHYILMADSVADVQNLGAMIRTAVCSGALGLILPQNRSAYPSPGVSKASAGAMEHIRISIVNNLVHTINLLKAKGYWVTGLDGSASASLFKADFADKTVIVVGGEEKGIRPLVKKNCDFLLAIPQFGPIGSLNASVAAALAMYTFVQTKLNV